MGSGPQGGRPATGKGDGSLKQLLLRRMAGGDLPPGAVLRGDRMARLFEVEEQEMHAALGALAREGRLAETGEGVWRVTAAAEVSPQEVLKRLAPVLRAVVALAAGRITPVEAAGVLAAYDRFAGLAGDGTDAARVEGYALLLRRLADGAGSGFHARALEQMIAPLAPLAGRLVAQHVSCYRNRPPDDGLARLARALMAADAHGAEAALEDHLMLLGSLAGQSG
jgi:DNA-binding GntR family transcriptional regulator